MHGKSADTGLSEVMKKIIANNFANPYLPLWEHLPDGEPRVFEDPDNPGKFRAYVIGSHDVRFDSYCGPDIRAWSAPVENLTDWRDEGSIFTYQIDNQWDVMYAPDLVEIRRKDGTKDYYLYPHSRGANREAMVCHGKTPTGPFSPINLTADGLKTTPDSILGFDPAVYIEYVTDPNDPDFEIGFRAYGYWGFKKSHAAQLDQTTMYSLRPGTEIIHHFIPASASYGNVHDPAETTYPHVHPDADLNNFNFFEAASIRKIGNKYVWIFSGYSGPEYGLPSTNSTLRYAYGDTLLGPWQDGGVLVDSRSIGLNENGTELTCYYAPHNTHGSIEYINDQWYCFYHRPPRGFGFARQAMVAPIQVQNDELTVAEGGKITITGWSATTANHILTVKSPTHEYPGAEVTSEGFNIYGLDPYRYYSAGIACVLSNHDLQADAWDIWDDHMPLVDLKNNDFVGYKYFGFGGLQQPLNGLTAFSGTAVGNETKFNLYLLPKTSNVFTIEVWLDRPWASNDSDAKQIGVIAVAADSQQELTHYQIDVAAVVDQLDAKHAIYLVARGGDETLCDLIGLGFSSDEKPIAKPVVPVVAITLNGQAVALPTTPVRATNTNGICDYDQYELTVSGYDEVPVIGATADTDGVEIAINCPATLADCATVKFNYQGVEKTYKIIFEALTRSETTRAENDHGVIKEYTLKNDQLELRFLNLGGAITKIALAADDFADNLVLDYQNVAAYQNNGCYLNALVGRTSNRITDGKFTINGQEFQVECNDGPNNLHGGTQNLTHAYFAVSPIVGGYELKTRLDAQDDGFPGDLAIVITYQLDGNRVKITYSATSSEATIFNPTQHAYFNLSGNAKDTINNHVLQIDADQFAEINEESSFTKQLLPTAGTRFDFTTPVKIDATTKPASTQFDLATGYDHLFILNQNFDGRPAATLFDPVSTRRLQVFTTEPTMQFYAGNYIDEQLTFTGDVKGVKNLGACFETHKNPFDFASQIIDPGVATTVQETIWEFTKGAAKNQNIAPK